MRYVERPTVPLVPLGLASDYTVYDLLLFRDPINLNFISAAHYDS